MTSAEAVEPHDEARWRELLPARDSVFGCVEFARIQQRHAGVEPRLFAFGSGRGGIVHPLLLRPIAALPFARSLDRGWYDAATPPYCGPVAAGPPSPEAREAFASALSAWCAESGVVTEFAHLHPWHARTELLDGEGLRSDREIVYVDLALDEERMWRESFTHACRKNVNRARREGVRVRAADTEEGVGELHRIYDETMRRRGALEGYRFGAGYFRAFPESLPANSRILVAEHDGRAIAATLYLHDDMDVYSYLGGADHWAQRLRPTNAIVDAIIRWGREQGKKRLVLGGGYGRDDGILRFKSSFSPLRAEFRTWRSVRMPAEYAALCEAWREGPGAGTEPGEFFPPYRAEPPQPG